MDKRVIFNGIEILTSDDDASAKSFFEFTQQVIELLEQEMDRSDDNFRLDIRTDFSKNTRPKHHISVNGLNNQKTKAKIVRVLQSASNIIAGGASGSASVSLIVEDN